MIMAKYDNYRATAKVTEGDAEFYQEISILFEDGDDVGVVVSQAQYLMYQNIPEKGIVEDVYKNGVLPPSP